MAFDPNAPFEIEEPVAPAAAFDPDAPFDVEAAPGAGDVQRQSRGFGRELARQIGLTARAAIQGAPQALDMLHSASAAVLNAPFAAWDAVRGNAPGTSEPFRYGFIGDAARGLADALGLPTPETPAERVMGAVVEGVAGTALPFVGAAGLARGIPRAMPQGAQSVGQTVIRAFADSPGVDAVAGAVGGAAQGVAQEAGAGQLGQVGANLGGSFSGAVLANLIIAAVARRRMAAAGRMGEPPRPIDPASITQEELADALADPDVRRVAEANGITAPDDPRLVALVERLGQRRAAEADPLVAARQRAETASTTNAEGEPLPFARLETPGQRVARVQGDIEARVDDEIAAGLLRPEERQAEIDRRVRSAALVPEARPAPAVVEVTPSGQAVPIGPDGLMTPEARSINEGIAARARPEGRGALVPTEPQPQRMTPGEIARARAEMEGGNPNLAEPPPRMVAPEGRAPQTPDQVQEQRQAGEAFRLAERQRARAGETIRDTQPAGLPEGPQREAVFLDEGRPVRILYRDDRGFVTVERYDPRTGQPEPDAVPYVIRERNLQRATYTQDPRRAQDFGVRSRSPGGDRLGLPRQTYRTTPPDPNTEFPGATSRRGDGEPPAGSGGPTGRSPFPEQPEGPSPGRRWSSAEEAERAFQQRRAQAEEEARRARERGAWSEGTRTSNKPRGQDPDGRWFTDDHGYVRSDAGGPIRFGDQKQAARWILREGQGKSPDQFFEIAVHPSGQGFTVREAGRNPGGGPGAAGGSADRGAAASGAPPRTDTSPVGPRRLTGPDATAERTPDFPGPRTDAEPGGAPANDRARLAVPESDSARRLAEDTAGASDAELEAIARRMEMVDRNTADPDGATAERANTVRDAAAAELRRRAHARYVEMRDERLRQGGSPADPRPPRESVEYLRSLGSYDDLLFYMRRGDEDQARADGRIFGARHLSDDEWAALKEHVRAQDDAGRQFSLDSNNQQTQTPPRDAQPAQGERMSETLDPQAEQRARDLAGVADEPTPEQRARDLAGVADEPTATRATPEPARPTDPEAAWAELGRLGREAAEAEDRTLSARPGTPEMDAIMRDVDAAEARFRAAREAYDALPERDFIVTERHYKDRTNKFTDYDLTVRARSAAEARAGRERLVADYARNTGRRAEVVGVRSADEPAPVRAPEPEARTSTTRTSKIATAVRKAGGVLEIGTVADSRASSGRAAWGVRALPDGSGFNIFLNRDGATPNIAFVNKDATLEGVIARVRAMLGADNVTTEMLDRARQPKPSPRAAPEPEAPRAAAAQPRFEGTPRQQGEAAQAEAVRRIREAADQNPGLSEAAERYAREQEPGRSGWTKEQVTRSQENRQAQSAFRRGVQDAGFGFTEETAPSLKIPGLNGPHRDTLLAAYRDGLRWGTENSTVARDLMADTGASARVRRAAKRNLDEAAQKAADDRFPPERTEVEMANPTRDLLRRAFVIGASEQSRGTALEAPAGAPASDRMGTARWQAEAKIAARVAGWAGEAIPHHLRGKVADAYAAGVAFAEQNPEGARPFTVTIETARGRQTHYTFVSAEAARATAERLSKLPAATFYSNPLDPALVKRLLLDPAFDAVRGLRNALASSSALQPIRDAARAIERTWRWFTQSNRAAMRAIERRYANVPEITELINHLATDPGTGRVVRETFETAFESRAKAMMNRLGNVAGRGLDNAGWERLRDLLTGTARPRDAAEAARAQSVRRLLNEQHDYLKKAGVDLGYVRGRYFPRVLDTEKVLANAERFQADAAALYRRMGLGAAEARQAAEDWFNRVLGIGGGGRDYPHVPAGRFIKGRTLPPDADRIMREWYVTDPREALSIYFRSSSRVAEFTRRFGRNGEKADALFDAMLRKGVRPEDVALLRAHFESATGTMRTTVSGPVRAAAQWAQTLGVLALLPRAVIPSLTEGLAVGARTGNVLRGLEAFADTWRALAGAKSMQQARQMAELWGVVSDAMTDQMLLARMGGGVETRTQRRLATGMFHITGLHQITEAQRVAATRIGQVWIRQLADEVAEGAPTKASALRLLRELGMEEADARALSAWLKRNGGQPKVADLLGDAPEAHAYRTAVTRFVNESIQNPEAVDRPALANAPVGRLAYGITSFMFAFTRNVLLRSVKQGAEAIAGEGYTLADRARLAGPLVGFMVLAASQFGVSRVREMLLNPQQNEERDPWVRTILDLDRAGLFGTASPIINMISSAKYERDPSSLLTGPYLNHYLTNLGRMTLGLVPQPMGPNSPHTNNAEWAAVRAGYQSVVAPALVAALSVLPGPAPLKAVYGVGAMALSSPGAARAAADLTVGERTVRPRTAGGSVRSAPRHGVGF